MNARHLGILGPALISLAALATLAAACGGSDGDRQNESAPLDPAPSGSSSTTGPGGSSGSSGTTRPGEDGSAGDGASSNDGGASADAAVDVATASCASPIPPSGARALALPTYAGTCPALAAAPAVTTLASSGAQRQFLVFRPAAIAAGETLPVVFLWHWLGGSAEQMGSVLEVQNAVEQRRFIGVVPVPKGDALFRWPFEATQSQGRVDEEARFFDDMLACVGAALPANKECVSSVGVSAGALWTAQLAAARSQRLSSMVSLSGGVGGVVRGWTSAPHRLPALVLWGGPDDMYPANVPIMNFQNASKSLIGALATDGHYITECTHNCGHAVPPFDPPAPGGVAFDAVWRFVLDHPYWLPASTSPYAGKPLPAAYPAWCGQGAGSAVPRPSNAACP